jgi:hypothetical protein
MSPGHWRLVLLLALATPAWAGDPVRCTTYEERTLGRLQTLYSDGTRAVSTWNRTLERWDTTITPPTARPSVGKFRHLPQAPRR